MDSVILGKSLEGDEDFSIKVAELVTGRTAVVAKTGYGKSWTIRRIVEQLLEKRYPVGIIDPEGEHTSLADLFDMLILSPEGDVDLSRSSPFRLARVAVEGVSFVLDLSKYRPDTAIQLSAELIKSLMRVGSTEGFLVVVDEAKELAPERGAGSTFGKGVASTLTWLNTLATRGRKKGIGLLFSTQRPQLVSKTLLSQAENKIILRVEYSRDLEAIVQYLGLNREVASEISKLDRGIAYVEGPFAVKPGFVKIGEVESAHLGSTPNPKPRPPPSLQEVVKYLKISGEPSGVEGKREEGSPSIATVEEERPGGGRGKAKRSSNGKEAKGERRSISVRSDHIWSLPSKKLTSDIVKGIVERRNEMRELLSTLEGRKDEMDEAVYQLLREEYKRELNHLEKDLEPYKKEAIETGLMLEAAIEDRRNLIKALSLKKTNPLKRISVRWKIRKLRGEIRALERRLERVRSILRELE